MPPLMKGSPLAVSIPYDVMGSTARAVSAMNAHRLGQSPSWGDVLRQRTVLFWGRRAYMTPPIQSTHTNARPAKVQ